MKTAGQHATDLRLLCDYYRSAISEMECPDDRASNAQLAIAADRVISALDAGDTNAAAHQAFSFWKLETDCDAKFPKEFSPLAAAITQIRKLHR
jgi:hypothetical protein